MCWIFVPERFDFHCSPSFEINQFPSYQFHRLTCCSTVLPVFGISPVFLFFGSLSIGYISTGHIQCISSSQQKFCNDFSFLVLSFVIIFLYAIYFLMYLSKSSLAFKIFFLFPSNQPIFVQAQMKISYGLILFSLDKVSFFGACI